MSIQDEINRINQNVANTYSALGEMGATMPETQNSDNLARTALTVPQGGASNTLVFKMAVSFSASGASFSLPQETTYETLNTVIDNNVHIVAVVEIPSFAGDLAGTYVAPFSKRMANGDLCFAATTSDGLQYFLVHSDSSVSYGMFDIELTQNKTTFLSLSSTDTQYPTAKAVYDLVSRNSTIVIDVLGTADDEGYLYLDEETELQIYNVVLLGVPAVIRYRTTAADACILLHHVGQGVFVSMLVLSNVSFRLVYDRDKLALHADQFAHTEYTTSTE